jgi:hypothetical protein
VCGLLLCSEMTNKPFHGKQMSCEISLSHFAIN